MLQLVITLAFGVSTVATTAVDSNEFDAVIAAQNDPWCGPLWSGDQPITEGFIERCTAHHWADVEGCVDAASAAVDALGAQIERREVAPMTRLSKRALVWIHGDRCLRRPIRN